MKSMLGRLRRETKEAQAEVSPERKEDMERLAKVKAASEGAAT